MNVQKISFKNNLSQPEQRVSSGQSAVVTTPSDKFESSNKKDNTGKYLLAGIGVVATIVAIIKHKQIGDFFSKLFKSGGKSVDDVKTPKQKPPITEEPSIVPLKPKFELSKPEFKFDETNPKEFAKEKEAYIKSIISHANKDENVALDIMEQFDKYGSNELLKDLLTPISLLENKTDKVANKYLSLYNKFTQDEPNIEKILTAPLSAIIKDYGNALSKDSIMLIIKGFTKAGERSGDLLDVKGFIKGDKYYHPFLAKFNQTDLGEIDKFAQEAEEVVRKRVYKD